MSRARRGKAELPLPSNADIQTFSASSDGLKSGLAAVAKDAQTSLRLPQGMYDALNTAATAHGVGVGEEIRARLESSFILLLGSPETRRLMEAIGRAAHQIEPIFGSWLKDPFAFAVF